jgi:hypothetical protein
VTLAVSVAERDDSAPQERDESTAPGVVLPRLAPLNRFEPVRRIVRERLQEGPGAFEARCDLGGATVESGIGIDDRVVQRAAAGGRQRVRIRGPA